MDRIDLRNDTDDEIVIEPGDSIRIRGEKEIHRVTATRRRVFVIKDTGRK